MTRPHTSLAPLRRTLVLLLLLSTLTTAQTSRAQDSAPLDLATYPRTDLTITQAKPPKVHAFRVWVADTPQRAEQGLMFVNDLPESEGMLFPLDPPRVENMWMKNTYIALDMLFVDTKGRVTKIIERAQPLSLATLSSDGSVRAVLELKGGTANQLGIKVGDLMQWKTPTTR